ISSITERTTSARRAVSRRSTDPTKSNRFSISGSLLDASRNNARCAGTGLAGDDLLEQVRYAEREEVDGLVHLRKVLSVGRPHAIAHPGNSFVRYTHPDPVGGFVPRARTLALPVTLFSASFPRLHACQTSIQ